MTQVYRVFAYFGLASVFGALLYPARHLVELENGFRASASPAVLAALLVSVLACASNTLSGIDEPDFGEIVRHYRTLERPKALALATEANGRWAYGARFASGSREQAIEGALEACRGKTLSGGMLSRCFLFAVDDEPAPDTVRGCLARKIPSRRCQMQRRHRGDLSSP